MRKFWKAYFSDWKLFLTNVIVLCFTLPVWCFIGGYPLPFIIGYFLADPLNYYIFVYKPQNSV